MIKCYSFLEKLSIVLSFLIVNYFVGLYTYSKTGAYILPIKAEVRKKEKITAGDVVSVIIDLI